jgi:hypothetical protein
MKRSFNVIPYPLVNGSGVGVTRYGLHDDFLMVSENHSYDRKKGKWRSGGPFVVKHTEKTHFVGPLLTWKLNGVTARMQPNFGYATNSLPVPQTNTSATNEAVTLRANAWSYGATGWARSRPGNPTANVLTSLAETAREGLPRIPLNLFKRLSDLIQGKNSWRQLHGTNPGSEYLNGIFGWLPLLNDIRDMYQTYRNLDKQLAQIYRDNGNGIHRRREIKNTITVTSPQDLTWNFPFGSWQDTGPTWASGRTRFIETVQNIERVWFVGKFRYYIPDIGTSQWKARATRALFGLNPTPEVIWNLLPWSWLADWFGNVGDMMSNMSSNAVDNLTAEYAYVMRTLETRSRMSSYTHWNQSGTPNGTTWIPSGTASGEAFSSVITKTRVVGSPYGFGANFDSFSNYQLGVLAALGISRV